MAPFEEDVMVCGLAESLGLELSRRYGIVVTNDAAVKAAGLVRECPDYTRIRKLLDAGAAVEGVELAGTEYILRRQRCGL
jgi:hypothetical protein